MKKRILMKRICSPYNALQKKKRKEIKTKNKYQDFLSVADIKDIFLNLEYLRIYAEGKYMCVVVLCIFLIRF